MTAVSITKIILPILAGLSVLLGLYFFIRSREQRTGSTRSAYNVGRQEARQAMQLDVVRMIVAFVVGVLLFGVFSLIPDPVAGEVELVPTERPFVTSVPDIEQPQQTPEPLLIASPLPSPSPVSINTVTPIPTVTTAAAPPTPTTAPVLVPTEVPILPGPPTAIVSSGVGVWLRGTPSTEGEQLEWLLDGTELILLAGQTTADEFEWQEVQAPSGNTGWVAAEFILFPDS
ncbi:MAG: SH3 domain-containing protein [Chloroflexi bacterium]|nr:SH3 domain-containing protein [Chloroflexota bacterium]